MGNRYRWILMALTVALALACDPGSGARLGGGNKGATAAFALRFLVPAELETATVKATLIGRTEALEKIAARAYGFSKLPAGTYDLSVDATLPGATASSVARVSAIVIPEAGGVDLGELTFIAASSVIKGVAKKRSDPTHAGITVEVVEAGKLATTDDLGNYEITGLAAGTYSVKFTAAPYTNALSAVVAAGETKVLETVVLGEVQTAPTNPDGTAGAAFKVTLNDGAAFSTSPTVRVKLTAPAAVTKVRLSELPMPTGEYVPVTTATFTFSGEGNRTLYALFEAQTQAVSATIMVDTTPPSNVSLALADGTTTTNKVKPPLKLTASDAREMRFALSATALASTTWSTFSTNVTAFDIGPSEGAKEIWYQVRDAAGNATQPAKTLVTLALIGPQLATVSTSTGKSLVNDELVTIVTTLASTNLLPATKISVSCNGTTYVTQNYLASVAFDLEATNGGCSAGEGTRNLQVRLQDALSNNGPAVTLPITLDTTAPAAPTNLAVLLTPGPNHALTSPYYTKITAVTVIGRTDPGAKVTLAGASASATVDADANGDFTSALTLTPNATNAMLISAVDAAGNSSNAAAASLVHDTTPPVISNVTIELTSETALVRWTTNEHTTGLVEHMLDPLVLPYTNSSTSPTAKLNHDVLLTLLDDDNTYHARITATDRAGNVTVGTNQTYRTYLDASSAVESDTTWENTTIRYVSGNFRVDPSQTLTIMPGTRIVLGPDTLIKIDGRILALGTASEPIVFTSPKVTPAPGDWDGIFFPSNCTKTTFDGSNFRTGGSLLSHVVIEWAGKSVAAVRGQLCNLMIQDTVIRKSATAGIRWIAGTLVGEDAKLVVRDTVIKDNVGNGITLFTASKDPVLNFLAFDSTFAGNGAIGITSDYADSISITNGIFAKNSGGFRSLAEGTTTVTRAIVADNAQGIQLSTMQGSSDPAASHAMSRIQYLRNGTDASTGAALRDFRDSLDPRHSITSTDSLFVGNRGASNAGAVDFSEGDYDASVLSYIGTIADISRSNVYGNTSGYAVRTNIPHPFPAADILARDSWWNAPSGLTVQAQLYDYTKDLNLAVVKYRYVSTPPEIRKGPRTRIGLGAPLAPTIASPAAGQVSLTWNESPEPDVKGYVIHHGTAAGVYSATVDTRTGATTCGTAVVNGVTRRTCTLTGVPAGPRFFAVTSYDGGDLEQVFADSAVDISGATDTITVSNHGFRADQLVVASLGSGVSPAVTGILVDTPYYVRGPTASTFQLATAPGGGAVDFTPPIPPEGTMIFTAALDTTLDVDTGAEELTLAGHGLQPGQRVELQPVASGALPGGLTAGTSYYVLAGSTADRLQLSLTDGGTAINLTSTGSGLFRFIPNKPHPRSPAVKAHTIPVASINLGTNTFTTAANHGYANGQVVRLSIPGGDRLAARLVAGFDYYVRDVTATTFTISDTRGGTPVDIGGVIDLEIPPVATARIDPAADTILAPAHGLYNGSVVRFVLPVGGALPANLALGTDYYVINSNARRIQVSLTSGGAAVDIGGYAPNQFRIVPQDRGTGFVTFTPMDRDNDRRFRGNESWYSTELSFTVP